MKQTRDQWKERTRCCRTDHFSAGGTGLSVVYEYEFKGRGCPILFPELERFVSNFKCAILHEDSLLKIFYDPDYKFPRLSWGQFTKVYMQA